MRHRLTGEWTTISEPSENVGVACEGKTYILKSKVKIEVQHVAVRLSVRLLYT